MNEFWWVALPVANLGDRVFGGDVFQMVAQSGWVGKLILILLLVFSILCWTVTFFKFRLFRLIQKENRQFLSIFWESGEIRKISKAAEGLRFSPIAALFRQGYTELTRSLKSAAPAGTPGAGAAEEGKALKYPPHLKEQVESALDRAMLSETDKLGRYLSFLATAGNTSPLIGLFGTVWGLMEAFMGIGAKGSANLAVVAPGISEALTTTAAGLMVAIPAVFAFNHFNHQIATVRAHMDIFASDFLSLVGRQVLRDGRSTHREA